MKANSFKKDIFLIIPFAAMWVVYFLLRNKLPAEIGSHFYIENGEWVANSYMKPLALMIIMTICYIIVYGSLSLVNPAMSAKTAMLINPIQVTDKMLKGFWIFKAGILTFLSLITIHMLWGGVEGSPNSELGTGIIAGLLLVINGFVFYIFHSVKKSGQRLPLSPPYYNVIWVATHVVVTWPIASGLASSAGIQLGGKTGIYLFIFAFMAILGNVMYNIKPNLYIGIRTPWTLKSEEVWKRTHRFGGIAMFFAGLVAFILMLTWPDAPFQNLLLLVVLVGGVIPAIYSYIVYRQLHQIK